MTSNGSNKVDYFEHLYEPRSSKTWAVVVSGCWSIVCVALLYSTIWFEKYGSDHKRTIQVPIES
jgi:hypothetical protein